MPLIRKRQAAKRDLIQQWTSFAEAANFEVADRFVSAVEYTLKLLAGYPESGIATFTRAPQLAGLRRFPVSRGFESILLSYLPREDGIDLIRVTYGRRAWDRLSKTPATPSPLPR